LFEKNKSAPTVKISINDRFIGEFICDNEKMVEASVSHERDVANTYDTTLGSGSIQKQTRYWSLPAKLQKFELDSTDWNDSTKLDIQITNNKSNYNNGFVSKRSLVTLNPIYLIPAHLLDDTAKMSRLLKKSWQVSEGHFKTPNRKSRPDIEKAAAVRQDKWQWPGEYSDEPKLYGGDCKIKLKIKCKNKLYYVTNQDIKPFGHPVIGAQFFAWLNRFTGVQRYYKIKVRGFYKEANLDEQKSIEIVENTNPDQTKYLK